LSRESELGWQLVIAVRMISRDGRAVTSFPFILFGGTPTRFENKIAHGDIARDERYGVGKAIEGMFRIRLDVDDDPVPPAQANAAVRCILYKPYDERFQARTRR
jgi:hypothetical protein